MTKTELIKKVSKRFLLTQPEVKEIIKYFLDQIISELQKGDRVYLRGFGYFDTKIRKAKRVRHPKTKKILTIPEHKDIDFKPSKKLLTKLNNTTASE